jgi:peptidyl-prolyl cis-trans isomerase D
MAKQPRKINPSNLKVTARIERERQQRQIIIIISIIVAVIVVGITAYGLITEGLIEPQKAAITVDDTEITVAEFQAWGRYRRYNLVNQYINYFQFMQQFGDENTRSLFENNLTQIQFQLEPAFLGSSLLEEIVSDVFIRREAEELGITVSKEEIDSYIAENLFSYYVDGTPTPKPTQETLPTSTLSPEQLTLVTQVPTAAPTEVPVEEPTATATEAEETDAEESEAEPAPTIAVPTATAYTVDAYQTQLIEYIEYIDTYASVTESDLRKMIESDLYRTKFMEALTADLAAEEEQIWARHILVAEEEEAKLVIERLEAGEDFAALAQELSTDTGSGSRGGDLGWFGNGQMVAEFEEAAFELEFSEISAPVQSQFGWHIIQLLGQENRAISDDRLEQIRQQTLSEWLTEQREAAEVVYIDDWVAKVPTEPTIPQQLLEQP